MTRLCKEKIRVRVCVSCMYMSLCLYRPLFPVFIGLFSLFLWGSFRVCRVRVCVSCMRMCCARVCNRAIQKQGKEPYQNKVSFFYLKRRVCVCVAPLRPNSDISYATTPRKNRGKSPIKTGFVAGIDSIV